MPKPLPRPALRARRDELAADDSSPARLHPFDAVTGAAPTGGQEAVRQVPIGDVAPSPDNPRKDVGDVEDLAESIRSLGIIEPLIVRPAGLNRWVLVAGERRWTAAGKAGLDTVPVIVRDLDDQRALAVMLVENCHRLDLTPVEEATTYHRLITEHGYSQRSLGRAVGRSQAHISKRLALLELPTEARDRLESGAITLDEAVLLARLKDHPDRLAAALNPPGYGWSVKEAAENQLEEVEQERKRSAVEAELRAGGTNVVPAPQPGHHLANEAVLWPQNNGWTVQGKHINLPVEQHASEPCHAAIVSRSGGTVWVCTSPKRHQGDGASDLKTQPTVAEHNDAGQDQEQRARRKAELAAQKARTAFLQAYLAGPKRGAVGGQRPTHIHAMVLLDANHAPAKKACELLQIPPIESKSYGGVHQDWTKALQQYPHPDKAALALVLGLGEEWVNSQWTSWADGKSRQHLAFLQSIGYQLSAYESERIALDGGRARKDDGTEEAADAEALDEHDDPAAEAAK